jgi:recombination associated protein RdgC
LGLTWSDRISFVLTEKLQIKRVEFLEISREAEEGSEVDAAEKFDIDLTVMTGELAKLLSDLVQAFGGESVPQAAAA